MKTNFRKESTSSDMNENTVKEIEKKELSKEEFEEYVSKSGAKGSFMIYRSQNKDEELGLDEL